MGRASVCQQRKIRMAKVSAHRVVRTVVKTREMILFIYFVLFQLYVPIGGVLALQCSRFLRLLDPCCCSCKAGGGRGEAAHAFTAEDVFIWLPRHPRSRGKPLGEPSPLPSSPFTMFLYLARYLSRRLRWVGIVDPSLAAD